MPDRADAALLTAAQSSTTFRRELLGWSALGVGALAIAGLFAFLLAFSRIPGIEAVITWPLAFFHKGLVIHVVFSFVVWFLAMFGALAALAGRMCGLSQRYDGLGVASLAAAVLSVPLLFIPAFLDRGEPTLNNYVPVIIDPLYYGGLALLAGAVGAAALRLLLALRLNSLRREPLIATIAAAAIAYLLALLCFAIAYRFLAGTPLSHEFNESLMWGGGHALQFVNTLLLLAAWIMLSAPYVDRRPTAVLALASGMLLLSVMLAPVFYLVFPSFAAAQTEAFTNLQYALGPSVALAAAALLARLRRPWPWHEPGLLALALSMLLFAVGGLFGLFVDGADTRTPAHYHGVIASLTVAFFGLQFAFIIPLLGGSSGSLKRQRVILHIFAWGQLTACIGLFVAGGYGAPRKVAGSAQGLTEMMPMIGMGMNGVGGLIAVVGGILFVWAAGSALVRLAVEEKRLAWSNPSL